MKKLGIVGLIIVLATSYLLWWNEGKCIDRDKIVGDIRYTNVSSETISASNDGLLIFTTGPVNMKDIDDEQYDVSVESQILKRKVEMYQWVENIDENGKASYSQEWREEYIDSNNFKDMENHVNPEKSVESIVKYANGIRIGSYLLTDEQLNRIETNKIYTDLSESVAKDYKYNIKDNYYTTSSGKTKIGDIRISFLYSSNTNMSLFAIQDGENLKDYVTNTGNNISKLYSGELNPNEVLDKISNSNHNILFIMRIVIVILYFIGIYIFINKSLSKNKIILSIGFTVILSLFIAAIRWYAYYSALSALLILIAIMILLIETYVLKKSKI